MPQCRRPARRAVSRLTWPCKTAPHPERKYDQNRPTTTPNNGGVFFLGTSRSCSKDGISVDTSAASGRSSFMADLLIFDSLGRSDPRYGDSDLTGDIDAVSLLGLDMTEWRVKAVRTQNSGDHGFDVTNSAVALDSLTVVNPAEDGLNVTSSTVQIRRSLTVAMSPSISSDRELFDLKVDDGGARISINRRAYVDLRGYWGSVFDEVNSNLWTCYRRRDGAPRAYGMSTSARCPADRPSSIRRSPTDRPSRSATAANPAGRS